MKSTGLACGLLSSLSLGLLAGCVALPDLQLAKTAKGSGDLATAEQNYRVLASQGYVEAQIGLADLLIRSPSIEQRGQGETLYRQALDRSPVAPARLGKWLASKPQASPAERLEAEKLLRQSLAAGDYSTLLPLVQLQLQDPQKLADGGLERELEQWQAQGIGEARLGKVLLYRVRGNYLQKLDEIKAICEGWLEQASECYVELAEVYQRRGDKDSQQQLLARLDSAYQAGLVSPDRVMGVAKVVADSSLGEADPKAAQELYTRIAPAYPDAWCGLAELVLSFPDQGDAGVLTGYLNKGIEAGSSRAALMLGQLYLKGQVVPADPRAAEQYLLQAAPGHLKAHLLLGRLYRDGALGDIEPEKALEHLLIAARAGDPSANIALAQLFGEGKGVRINAVYSYTFATLASRQGMAQGQVLMERLAPRLQAQDYQQVESLLAREIEARGGQQVTARNQADQAQEVL